MDLPPWIQAADPAAHMARGFQLGLSAAQEQAQEAIAANRQQLSQQQEAFYEQQALKEQQLRANEDARAQANFQLQSAAAARKSQALLEYQKRTQGGEDPLKVFMELGPAMGQPATSIAAAQRALSAKMMGPPTPQLVDLGGGVKGVRFGNQFHVLPQPKPSFNEAAVQGFPVLDPSTHEPIPGFVAFKNAAGTGMDVRTTKPAAELTPKEAFSMLKSLPELESTVPGITAKLGPTLTQRAESIAPKAKKAPVQVLPFPKSKKEAVKGSVYKTKQGPMRWDGERFTDLEGDEENQE